MYSQNIAASKTPINIKTVSFLQNYFFPCFFILTPFKWIFFRKHWIFILGNKLDNHLCETPIFHGSMHTKEMKEDFKLLSSTGISNKWTSWLKQEKQRKQNIGNEWDSKWTHKHNLFQAISTHTRRQLKYLIAWATPEITAQVSFKERTTKVQQHF